MKNKKYCQVSNALKLSGAVCNDNIIALTVQDNGCGFEPSTVAKGMGLNNIRNRVAAYGGNIMVDSEKGGGDGGECGVES